MFADSGKPDLLQKAGDKMNRPAEKDKRAKIIRAAVKVFSRKGFHDARVEEIAQLADVGKGTVYEYFSSKVELFQEMFKVGLQFYLDSMTDEINPGLSCREKLARIIQLHQKFVSNYRDLAKITMTEHTYFSEDFREWVWENRARKLGMLQQIIQEGIDKGEFRKINSEAASLVVMGALGALFSPAIFSEDYVDAKELTQPVLDVIMDGIMAPEGR
ncbi:TetR/AcrR family transcriptional regulator [Phosphitispora sp. TUW77]|uniref:TetR/AcrR family transcriptional regulator n=1 Tax=Phosphitispora sp. TUW77 TaxID=3152361 RepID=UPI003AB31D7E